jgi:hypothetical protein
MFALLGGFSSNGQESLVRDSPADAFPVSPDSAGRQAVGFYTDSILD